MSSSPPHLAPLFLSPPSGTRPLARLWAGGSVQITLSFDPQGDSFGSGATHYFSLLPLGGSAAKGKKITFVLKLLKENYGLLKHRFYFCVFSHRTYQFWIIVLDKVGFLRAWNVVTAPSYIWPSCTFTTFFFFKTWVSLQQWSTPISQSFLN